MALQEKHSILVGEEELELREYLETALTCLGYSVESAEGRDEVIDRLSSTAGTGVSAVLLDVAIPRDDAFETLKAICRAHPQLPVVVLSGHCSTLDVVAAIRSGASDFLVKPVTHADLKRALAKVIGQSGTRHSPVVSAQAPAPGLFLGSTPKMQDLRSRIKQIGWSGEPVLIQGETGCGKEVLARELHANSPRADKIFLKLNCAALPSELVESELFGYERGCFTGAVQKRIGMFEMAHKGTLLLDEIGDMDVRLQAKLLQVLQDHEFQRIGGKGVIKVDVRIISATHRNLEKAISDGLFRDDLYYRLNVINLHLPPLRERTDDILPLADFLLKKHTPSGVSRPVITPNLAQAFMEYRWAGNVRELENAVRKYIALRDEDLLVAELRARTGTQSTPAPVAEIAHAVELPKVNHDEFAPTTVWAQVKKAKYQTEANAITAALDRCGWNRKQAAELLQIEYKALLYKMKTLNIKQKSTDGAAMLMAE